MSPRHFSLMLNGFKQKKIDEYKQTRLIMFTMVKLMGDPKTSPKTPEVLWPLPGESESVINEQEYRDIFKRLKK